MLKKALFPFIFIGIQLLYSCSTDDDTMSSVETVITTLEGAYAEDNKWIYQQMNYHYLWREDLPDSLDCDYTTDPVTFFYSLLSPKDRFSYCERNQSYTGPIEKIHYGFEYQEYKNDNEETLLQVLYVTAEHLKKSLRRGDWLRRLGGSMSSIFERGTMTNEVFVPVDTLTIEANIFGSTTTTVYLDSIYTINNRKIGYLCYLEYDMPTDLEKSIRKFYQAGIDELILDLRYNPGGYVSTCQYLCNSIVPEEGYNNIFQQRGYNDILSDEMEKETGERLTKDYYVYPDNNGGQILGPKMYGLQMKKLYVLTSKYTASASEATIVCLRPYMDVFIIGEQTYGKGVGSYTLRDSKYKYQLQPITSRYYNALMETTPDTGFAPDIEIPEGYYTPKKELGDTNEPLLAAALALILGEETEPLCTRNTRNGNQDFWKTNGEPSFFQLFNEY